MQTEQQGRRVVVIGGGFGGLAAVRALDGAPVSVTLVDKRNHHLFQPLLYQVATAALSASDIAEPLRGILGTQPNVEVLLDRVSGIDLARRVVVTDRHEVPYDHLVVAAGAETSYFGHDAWAAHAPGLKTLSDALGVRQRLLHAFEEAEWCRDPARVARLLTFVVIGGGPTGVEMAGSIAEIARITLLPDLRHVDATKLRVVLVEAAPGLLGAMPAALGESARRHLVDLGVEVRTGAPVAAIEEEVVVLGDGERLEAGTIVWAAGVRGSPLAAALGVPLDRAGRVIVGPDLSIPGHPEVQVVGDLAHVDQDGSVVPGVAPAAIQMGRFAARCVRDDVAGRPRGAFRYADKGSLATIGRSRAVGAVGFLRLHGVLAWLVWAVVHLLSIVGYRNRAVVAVKWAWSYVTWDRSSRVMWTDEAERDAAPAPQPASPGSGPVASAKDVAGTPAAPSIDT